MSLKNILSYSDIGAISIDAIDFALESFIDSEIYELSFESALEGVRAEDEDSPETILKEIRDDAAEIKEDINKGKTSNVDSKLVRLKNKIMKNKKKIIASGAIISAIMATILIAAKKRKANTKNNTKESTKNNESFGNGKFTINDAGEIELDLSNLREIKDELDKAFNIK